MNVAKFRFSLRLLIVLVSGLTLFLGYSQYRRREILNVCAELKADGFVFAVPNRWHDYIWQRKPTVATVKKLFGREVISMDMYYMGRESHVEGTYDDAIQRLNKLGVLEYQ